MRLTVTQTGIIGMAPSNAQIGDSVCYIKGLTIPVILREKERALDSTVQEWLVIGGAYAHMDGKLPRSGSGGFGDWAETYFMKPGGLQSIVWADILLSGEKGLALPRIDYEQSLVLF